MGRRPPLPRPRSPGPLPPDHRDQHRNGGRHRPRPRTHRLTPRRITSRYTTPWDLTTVSNDRPRQRVMELTSGGVVFHVKHADSRGRVPPGHRPQVPGSHGLYMATDSPWAVSAVVVTAQGEVPG